MGGEIIEDFVSDELSLELMKAWMSVSAAHCLSRVGEGGTETTNVVQVKKLYFGDIPDIRFEGQGGVQNDSEVSDQGGGGDCVPVDGK